MSSLEGSNGADFSFDGIGDFNFDDLIENVPANEKSGTELKIESFKKTELFAETSNISSKKTDPTDFFDAKIFSRRDKDSIPKSEKILAGLLLEKEGHKPVLMTRSGEAVILEQRSIRIHQEADDGTEVVRTFDKKEITIGSLSDEQYARIHSSAMTNLAFIARQQKEINKEKKSGIKLKELANRRDFSDQSQRGKKSTIGSLFNKQIKYFSENRKEIDRKLDRFAFESKTIEKKRRREIDKKSELRDKMRVSKDEHQLERKEDAKYREIIVDSDK